MSPAIAALMPAMPTITPWHLESLFPETVSTAGNLAGAASAAWPASSLAMYVPFSLTQSISVDSMFTSNGTTASNSIDVGLYSADGRRLASKGLALQSGTSALQLFSFSAAIILGPGRFYMAISMNGTSGTLISRSPTAIFLQHMGVAQEDLSGAGTPGTLPATATFATMAQAYLPVFGLIRTGFTI